MLRCFVLSMLLTCSLLFASSTNAQNYGAQNDAASNHAALYDASPASPGSAAARMRPIGAPSAVDQFRRPSRYQETVSNQQTNSYPRNSMRQQLPSSVRQVAMLQGVPLPPNPPVSLPPSQGQLSVSPSDMAPIPRPNLNSGFATVDNCNCVSPASGYSAASGIGCGSNRSYISPASCNTPVTPSYFPQATGYVAPPAQIPGPAVMPVNPGFATGGIGAARVPRALISLGQQSYQVQVGQGLWGQPVAYVPGQSIRNWVRYVFP